MKKSESKYFNTAEKMDKAFLELLEKKDFEYITVKEICEKAGVNRSTFYLHYETISDLLSESTQYVFSLFSEYFKSNADDVLEKMKHCSPQELYLITPKYLEPYLQSIKDNQRLVKTIVKNYAILQMDEIYDKMFVNVFSPILERYKVPVGDRIYMMEFYIHGLMGIVLEWLKNGCEEPIEKIISIMQTCISMPNG